MATTDDPKRVHVVAPRRGDGPTGVYEYDVASEAYTRTIYEHPVADVLSFDTGNDGVLRDRVVVSDRKYDIRYLDREYQRYQSVMESFFGPEVNVQIKQWSADETKFLIFIHGPSEPGAYFLFDAETAKIELLFETHPNVDRGALGAMEVMEAVMSDGREIYSYVTHPVGRATEPAPLIILPHGGPQSRDYFDWSFLAEHQVFATRGYRVIQTQFRGGSGYGAAFADEGHLEWGGRIQKDIFESAQVLIDRGLAEPKNIGAWGWSHGGYVAGASTFLNSGVVSCAVAGAGIFDLRYQVLWARRTYGSKSMPAEYAMR